MRGGRLKGFQEQLQRTHGQNQEGWNQGGRWGWLEWGVVVGGKGKQLYLNNNKEKINKRKENKK